MTKPSVPSAGERKTLPRFRGEPKFVSAHHVQEVRKHFEALVQKYADADFSNTNTEAGCIWNDAVNLADGIVKERASSVPSATGTTAADVASDRAYINGANFGWNCGVIEDRKKFDEAIAGREAEIRRADSHKESSS